MKYTFERFLLIVYIKGIPNSQLCTKMSSTRQLNYRPHDKKDRYDHHAKKACLSECKALYKVDTYARTQLECKPEKQSDAQVDVTGRLILSKQCVITPGHISQDDCDPCITNFNFNICFPIKCEIENRCRETVGSSLIEVIAKNELYNKVKLLKVSKYDEDNKHHDKHNDKHHDKRHDSHHDKNHGIHYDHSPKLQLSAARSAPKLSHKKSASKTAKPADPARV